MEKSHNDSRFRVTSKITSFSIMVMVREEPRFTIKKSQGGSLCAITHRLGLGPLYLAEHLSFARTLLLGSHDPRGSPTRHLRLETHGGHVIWPKLTPREGQNQVSSN